MLTYGVLLVSSLLGLVTWRALMVAPTNPQEQDVPVPGDVVGPITLDSDYRGLVL